jgi:hypothetical protein
MPYSAASERRDLCRDHLVARVGGQDGEDVPRPRCRPLLGGDLVAIAETKQLVFSHAGGATSESARLASRLDWPSSASW